MFIQSIIVSRYFKKWAIIFFSSHNIVGFKIENKLFQNRIIKEIVSVTGQFIPMKEVIVFCLPGGSSKNFRIREKIKN